MRGVNCGNGVVFLGAGACGKSQLFKRFVGLNFDESHQKGAVQAKKSFNLWLDDERFFSFKELSGLSESAQFPIFSFSDPHAQETLKSANILLMCVDVSTEVSIVKSLAYYRDRELHEPGLSAALECGELCRIVVFTKVDLNPTFDPADILLRLSKLGVTASAGDAYFSTSAKMRKGLAELVAYAEERFSVDRLCEVDPDTAIGSRIFVGEIDYSELGAEADDVPAELREFTEDESEAEDEDVQSKSCCTRLLSCWCNLFASCFGRRADSDSESETASDDSAAKP